MPKESLQSWCNSDETIRSKKQIISKFGVGDYYPECERNDILKRNIRKLEDGCSFPNYLVYQMNFFSTLWNNNLILYIEGEENNYNLKLIVYEMPHRQMKEIFEVFFIDWICPGTLYEARRKAKEAERRLRSDNPILGGTITPKLKVTYYDDYNSYVFPIMYGVGGEEVKRIEVDFDKARYNPDDYFKPLDIAMVFNERWVHVCICLGQDRSKNEYKICHARGGNRVKIESWGEFLFDVITPHQRKIIRYHPAIAFKRTDEIIKHIANCVEGESVYYEKKGVFDVLLNNCEHFANRCVLGLNFSELKEKKVEEKRGTKREREPNVAEHLDNTKQALDSLVNNVSWNKVNDRNNRINEIKECRRNSRYENFDVMRDGCNMYDTCIEVQPKSSIFKDMYREYLNRQ